MVSYIEVFGMEIPLYGVCFWTGALLGAVLLVLACPRRRIERYDMVYSAVFAMIGAMIGAKGLFFAVSWRDIVEAGIPLIQMMKGGFVFYGGLFGGIAGLWIYVRAYRLPMLDFTDIYALAVPFGHAIGRVGCFFAGCCYGVPYDGFGCVVYQDVVGQTPTGVPLLPIQLIEAGCLLLLFAVNGLIFVKCPGKRGLATGIYLIGYSLIRFCLEFLRGDAERGMWLGLSTAQWMSLGILAVVVFGLLCRKGKKHDSY